MGYRQKPGERQFVHGDHRQHALSSEAHSAIKLRYPSPENTTKVAK
jgi:hypothetical protein